MERSLSNKFELINNSLYENEYKSVLQSIQYKSIYCRKEQSLNQDKHPIPKKQEKQQLTQICFQLKQKQLIPQNSQGIIFFIQNYEYLMNLNCLNKQYVHLKQILVKFYTQDFINISYPLSNTNQNQNIKKNPLSILISPDKIYIYKENQQQMIFQFKNNNIFPQNPDSNCGILQKKFWIQINKKINKINFYTGDIQDYQEQKTKKLSQILVSNISQNNFDWKHCQKNYEDISQNKQCKQTQLQSSLLRLSHFKIFIKFQTKLKNDKNKQIKQIANPFENLKIKCLRVDINKSPLLKQTATILQPYTCQLNNLPCQLKSLYNRINKLSLLTLWDNIKQSDNSHIEININEENIKNAIHHSLVTPFNILQIKNQKSIPIGILNHVLKLKTDQQYEDFISSKINKKQFKDFYKYITKKRIGYIRFKVFQPKGCFPGSQAILQIWPPFYCSPIHNHGQAYGVIKVLAGQIQIQNFQDLSNQNTPYLKLEYLKGQCTWLSQNSFGIHRVLNLHSSIAITLQGYYDHKQGIDEYFSFVEQQNEKKKFSVYYPQHDWQNYLNKRSVQNKQDRQFVDNVIDKYELKNKITGKIDYSFSKFVQVMIKQYNMIKQILSQIS